MPIFNNAVIAALFKAPPNPNPKDANNLGNNKKNQNGIGIEKTKLVKQDMLTGATVLRLVFPMTNNDYYADLDDATTEQALETILDILENQEEGLALLGKQEWMENWPTKDNHCALLCDISNMDQEQITNYFQQGFEKVGRTTKEVWRFAIAGSSDISNLLKLAKATINEAQWRITININYFDEINFYFAGWLSGADPKVLQLTDVGNQPKHGKDQPSINQDRRRRARQRHTATVTGCTKMISPVLMVTCVQRNLTRLRRLFSMIKGNYFLNSYNEFILTKATQEHRWEKLGEHISLYSSKNISSSQAKVSATSLRPQYWQNK
jgi:hypothetical protein